MDERARLLLLSDVIGTIFGTEDFCIFLYSLVRMQAPAVMVELGTGLGASAFWMALAAKRNGGGHVFTVDGLELFEGYETLLSDVARHLATAGFGPLDVSTPKQYFREISTQLQLDPFITFVHNMMDLGDPQHFDSYPFANEPIDLVFSDFRHGPSDILGILGCFLPRMSPASSILIDSAPTFWPSYLLLERLIPLLNEGRIPAALQDRSTVDLNQVMKNRRIVLVHLPERKKRDQNSTAWLKIEPVDLYPQPRTSMRGV
jgi:hypothetical protein